MPPEDAGKLLARNQNGPSLMDWERVQRFFEKGAVGIDSLEPSNLDYAEAQKGAYSGTVEAEKRSVRATDQNQRDEIHQDTRLTLQEGAKATLVAAAIEGGADFVLAVRAKRREGLALRDFSEQDWRDVAADAGFGFAKGGVRGVSILSLTNFTTTSAAAASSIVTASFGLAEQANKLRRGEIDETQFIDNAEFLSLDAAVSALSSSLGQVLIPVPIIGAVIGNTVGSVIYRAASSALSEQEAALIERHLAEQHALDARLATEYQELLEKLDASILNYLEVLERAFSPDMEVALLGSVELARELGVDEVLDSEEKVLAYFLD